MLVFGHALPRSYQPEHEGFTEAVLIQTDPVSDDRWQGTPLRCGRGCL
jgi:hypothetical protein